MRRAIDFGNGPTAEADAAAYVLALGRSSAYTRGGRPPLPRCEGGRWQDEENHRPGRFRPCGCPERGRPLADCPYLLALAERPYRTPGGRAIVLLPSPRRQAQEGEIVAGVDLSPSRARRLSPAEYLGLEALPLPDPFGG